MAVYAALCPLKRKIHGYLKHCDACFDPPSLELAQHLFKEVNSFQEFVERLDSSSRKRMNAPLARILQAIPKFHYLFSSHFYEQTIEIKDRRKQMFQRSGLPVEEEEDNRVSFPMQLLDDDEEDRENQPPTPIDLPENEENQLFTIDLRYMKRDIHSFIAALRKVQDECDEEDRESSNKSKMVGLSDLYNRLKEYTVDKWGVALVLVGMAGIGKTTLAREIFQDLDIVEWFYFRAWVAVGRDWELHKIIRAILAQLKPDEDDGDERICECLKKCLRGKRYLIVLDDVWDEQVWSEVKSLLTTDARNAVGSRILITTRIRKVVDPFGWHSGSSSMDMRLLNEEESWDLLREKVFGVESCPFQLEKVGRRIAELCHGLPLTIVVVADLLSISEKKLEYWSEVAANAKHQLFIAAYDEVSKVLYSSYENLPQHLKICFLYMGVFPQNHEIPASIVRNLWTAEGLILDPNKGKSSKKQALKCLDELASNNVIVHKKSTRSSSDMSISEDEVKACGLHSSWWHLCYKEARKNNFFRVLNNLEDCFAETMRGQSRLSIHNNILLAIKQVYDTVEESCASSAHSLLLYGPYSRYPIPICSAFKLLRVLDASNIRFYEFPLQVLELDELRYLALTYDGSLPPSISKLGKLQFLIVQPHQNIRSCGDLWYLPLEIWDIKAMQHVQVFGRDLPEFGGSPLPNLLTLLDVSDNSCTKTVFERIPNLRKLGIRIELPPDHSGEQPLNCFDYISILKHLESLKCVVVNPEVKAELVPPPALPGFIDCLKKLSLSGMGYPWSEMSKIASLKKLQVLKLRCSAFQGPRWEIEEKTFPALEYLLIEDCDLEQWRVGDGNFRWLEHLSIKHCYNLEELDWEFDELISWIEVVDCDPVLEKQIKECKWRKGGGALDFSVQSSWNEKKMRTS